MRAPLMGAGHAFNPFIFPKDITMAAERGILEFEHQPSHSSRSSNSPVTLVRKAWAAFRLRTHSGLSAAPNALNDQIEAHDEPTFRLLLDLEQTRCKKSGRACHLLLCAVSAQDGTPITMHDAVTALVLTHVREVLRKTDYVGWFLQDRTVGILLTCLEPGTGVASSRRAMDRLRRVLTDKLSLHDPSLVLQLYDDLRLPPIERHEPTEATTPTDARQD